MAIDGTLSPARRLTIGAVGAVMATAGFAAGRILLRPNESVRQPIAFNHQLHVNDVGLGCEDCHEFYATSAHSGLPSLELCLGCHEEPLTESAEERELVRLAATDPQAEFLKLFRMPDHVYYSHRQHVTIAGLDCAVCHGDIADTSAPPPTPLLRITMDTCVECHEKNGVNTDCTHCHR